MAVPSAAPGARRGVAGEGAADPVDMGLADGTALVGVVWSPDGRHLAVLHQPPTAGEAVGVWDLDAAAFRGRSRSPTS